MQYLLLGPYALSHKLFAPLCTLSYHADFFRSNGTFWSQACGEGRQDDLKRDSLPEDPRTRAGAAVPSSRTLWSDALNRLSKQLTASRMSPVPLQGQTCRQ